MIDSRQAQPSLCDEIFLLLLHSCLYTYRWKNSSEFGIGSFLSLNGGFSLCEIPPVVGARYLLGNLPGANPTGHPYSTLHTRF